jgi:hypothetical protein
MNRRQYDLFSPGADNVRPPFCGRRRDGSEDGAATKDTFGRFKEKDLLWLESKDVWCVHLDPVWAEFHGTPSVGGSRPVPLVDAFPITLWLYKRPEEDDHNTGGECKKQQKVSYRAGGKEVLTSLSLLVNYLLL